MSPALHIAVLIPSHNEQSLLPKCLESVQHARSLLPADVTSDVIVAIDDSSDASFTIASELLGGTGAVFRINARCVGRARACAAEFALKRFSGEPSRCWFANTDADCEVPERWLLRHVDYAKSELAAVAGIVDVASFEQHAAHVERRFRETYLIHSDGTHPHVHGANLGVRADAYLRAGGWAGEHTAEDHSLWNRLGNKQEQLLSDASLMVLTSGRRVGRAPHGFADALAAHNVRMA